MEIKYGSRIQSKLSGGMRPTQKRDNTGTCFIDEPSFNVITLFASMT